MSETAEIYSLSDPRTGAVRYIGKANDAARRLKGHLRDARRRDTPVYRWIRKLGTLGLAPQMSVIGRFPRRHWQEAERLCIIRARRQGADLLNVAEGGDEPFCSLETRAANGRRNAAARTSTPLKAHLFNLKRQVGISLRDGSMGETGRAKLREAARLAPHLFGEWAAV